MWLWIHKRILLSRIISVGVPSALKQSLRENNTRKPAKFQRLCENSNSLIVSLQHPTSQLDIHCQSTQVFIHCHCVANICLLDWLCLGANSPAGDTPKHYWADLLHICPPKNTEGKISTEAFVGSAVIIDCVCTWKLCIHEKDKCSYIKIML